MTVTASDLMVGGRILAAEDAAANYWGVVKAIEEGCVVADYEGDTYRVQFSDIVQVSNSEAIAKVQAQQAAEALANDEPSKARALPPIPAGDGAPKPPSKIEQYRALSVTDRVNQKWIIPGIVITWKGGPSHGYHRDRLFVVLNYTKNSVKMMVNIAPMNGHAPTDPSTSRRNVGDQYTSVPIADIEPVFFSQPLRKMKGGAN